MIIRLLGKQGKIQDRSQQFVVHLSTKKSNTELTFYSLGHKYLDNIDEQALS